MLHFKKIVIILPLIFSITLLGQYKINVVYESGFEFKSQQLLISKLKNSKSRKEIENIIRNQDWIKDYSLVHKPFKKDLYLNIKNREPVFVLNEGFFYDKDLYQFKYDSSKRDLNSGGINKLTEDALDLCLHLIRLRSVSGLIVIDLSLIHI